MGKAELIAQLRRDMAAIAAERAPAGVGGGEALGTHAASGGAEHAQNAPEGFGGASQGAVSGWRASSPGEEPRAAGGPAARRASHAGSAQATQASGDDGASLAFKKLLGWLNVSDKSEAAIRERLGKSGFSAGEVDEAVAKAKSLGFIDDLRYADVLVRSRVAQRKGSVGIERELASQGIDAFALQGWPEAYGMSEGDELERALELLDAKPPKSRNLREGAYRTLVNKGYPSSVASSASRLWCESR